MLMAELNCKSSLEAMSIWKIEFELNPSTLSESKLSCESKKAESLHLCKSIQIPMHLMGHQNTEDYQWIIDANKHCHVTKK